MIVASPSSRARLALASTIRSTLIGPQRSRILVPRLGLAAPRLRVITPLLPPAPSAQVFTVERSDSVGFILLIVGLAGILALTLFWISPGRSSRHRNTHGGPTGPT